MTASNSRDKSLKVCQSLRKESFDALFMLISALVFYYVFSLLAKEDLFGPNSWDSYTQRISVEIMNGLNLQYITGSIMSLSRLYLHL